MKLLSNLAATLLIVSGVLCLTSCNEDGDDNQNPQSTSSLVGQWQYTSADISITIDEQDIVDYFAETFEISEDSAEVWKHRFTENMNDFDGMGWEFSADYTFEVTAPGGNETGTWTLSDDNKKLTISSEGVSEVIDVKSLTASNLELYYEEEFEEDADVDEIDETFAIIMTLTLMKE